MCRPLWPRPKLATASITSFLLLSAWFIILSLLSSVPELLFFNIYTVKNLLIICLLQLADEKDAKKKIELEQVVAETKSWLESEVPTFSIC
jgi:hypothetical protein